MNIHNYKFKKARQHYDQKKNEGKAKNIPRNTNLLEKSYQLSNKSHSNYGSYTCSRMIRSFHVVEHDN